MATVTANSHRSSNQDPVYTPNQLNPLRLAEAATRPASHAGGAPAGGQRGGLPLDGETIRAFHAALEARKGRRSRNAFPRKCRKENEPQ